VVRPKLEVRQSRDEDGYEVHGLEEVGPLSMDSGTGMDEVMAIFRRGNANRATAATAMNTDSSRSHSLLRVRVRSRNTLTVRPTPPRTLCLFQPALLKGSRASPPTRAERREGGLSSTEEMQITNLAVAMSLVLGF